MLAYPERRRLCRRLALGGLGVPRKRHERISPRVYLYAPRRGADSSAVSLETRVFVFAAREPAGVGRMRATLRFSTRSIG